MSSLTNSYQEDYRDAMLNGDFDKAEAILAQIEQQQAAGKSQEPGGLNPDGTYAAQPNYAPGLTNTAPVEGTPYYRPHEQGEYNHEGMQPPAQVATLAEHKVALADAGPQGDPYADFRRGTIDSSIWDRAMLGAGHRTSQIGEGLNNLKNYYLEGAANNWSRHPLVPRDLQLKLSDYAQGKQAEIQNYEQPEAGDPMPAYKQDLVKDTGLPGAAGEFLPYHLSGTAVGPVLSKIGGRLLGGISNVASVPVKVTGRGIGSLTDLGVSKGFGPAKWLNEMAVDPLRVRAAEKALSKTDLPLIPMLKGTGANIVGQTALGGTENALDSEKTISEGLIQGASGGVAAGIMKPILSRAVDGVNPLVSDAEQSLMTRLRRNYGIQFNPGETTGLQSRQVQAANFRHRAATQDMMQVYDTNQERKVANMIADGLGMPKPANGFTHADFANQVAELDKGYKAIADNTYGEFDPGIMGKINTHVANVLNDPTIPKDVKDLANKYRLAAHGYQTPDKQLVAAPYTLDDHASIMGNLKKAYNGLTVAPEHDAVLLAQQKYARAKTFEDSWAADPNLTAREIANHASATQEAKAELDALTKRMREAPSGPARKGVAKSINDIGKLLHFNASTQKAGNFITPDNLSIIDNHLSKIQSHLDEVGPRGASYNEVKAAHDEIIKALEPLKSNIATRNDSGNIVVDGSRLKNLREDLKGDINDFTLQNESRKANALKPLLTEVDNATKYTNGMTEETASDIRRKYALMKTAEANRFVNAGMRPDLTAVTKWVESEDELGSLLKGQPSIPQKQALHDAAAYHRFQLSQARSNQNNMGAIDERTTGHIMATPKSFMPDAIDAARAKLFLHGFGPIPKGWPGTTGLLNLKHTGPTSVYPLFHGLEQSMNLSGRAWAQGKETKEDLKKLYKRATQ